MQNKPTNGVLAVEHRAQRARVIEFDLRAPPSARRQRAYLVARSTGTPGVARTVVLALTPVRAAGFRAERAARRVVHDPVEASSSVTRPRLPRHGRVLWSAAAGHGGPKVVEARAARERVPDDERHVQTATRPKPRGSHSLGTERRRARSTQRALPGGGAGLGATPCARACCFRAETPAAWPADL